MVRALVLGASGFLGGQIALEAIAHGWEVRGLRRSPRAEGVLTDQPIEWIEGDLDRADHLAAAFEGVEVVFHAAGAYPNGARSLSEATAYGVEQTRRVLLLCSEARVKRLVYTSTLSTIGLPPARAHRLADERDHYLPGSLERSAYYESKYAMESEVLRAAAAGLPAVVLNPTAVFGPGDVHLSLARALLAAARGQVWFWVRATVNVVDVRDVAAAQVRAAESARPGERTILGGHNVSVRELLGRIAHLTGRKPPRREIPLAVLDFLGAVTSRVPGLRGAGHLQAIRSWQGYETAKAREELGLAPRPLDITLRDALEWLQSHGHHWRA